MSGAAGAPMPNVAPLTAHDPREAGPYRLIGRLGQGGQGVVYLGVDGDERRVAVKMLSIDLRQHARARARFAKEIAAAQRVATFCTAQVLEAELDAEPPYVVSEYIEGLTLHRHVRGNGPLSGNALYRLAVGTATALAAIHQAGVVHCDFKPDNVILGGDGPRVIDFGIARALGSETMTGNVMGTVPYMAPERFRNVDVGPSCDVFGWAATMAFASSGRGPFGHDSMATVMARVLHEEPDLSNLSGPLLGLVQECLAKDQHARPTAEQVLLRLLGHGAVPLNAALREGSDAATAVAVPAPPPTVPASPPTITAQPVSPAPPTQTAPRLPVDPRTAAATAADPRRTAPDFGAVPPVPPTRQDVAGPGTMAGPTVPAPRGPEPVGPQPPRRRRRWPVAVAALLTVALAAGGYLYGRYGGGFGPTDCVRLDVVSSTEKNVQVEKLARRYNDSGRAYGGECAQISVHGLTSGQAMEALAGNWAEVAGNRIPEPQVWLPTSTLWTGQLELLDRANKRAPQTPGGTEFPSIANSPLVIAMPAAKAAQVKQRGPLGWGDILGMSGEQGWASFGKPEWGRFTFGKDNPNLSTSGLAATIAAYYAASNSSSDLTEADIRNADVTRFVRRIEANVSHYSDDVVDLLRSLAAVDLSTVEGAAASDLSAIVTQEELVYLYNQGELSPTPGKKPKEPLVALYPKEGTFNLDHPYVVLPRASAAQQRGAADFLAFLQEPEQQAEFEAIGFRDHEMVASKDLIATVGGQEAVQKYFEPPAPGVVQAIKANWATLRKKANILMAVDVSGSMTANQVNGRTRLEVAVEAASDGIALLNSEDRVGLWAFSSRQGGERLPYRVQYPLSKLDSGAYTAKLRAMKPGGLTALYATVRAAHHYMLANYDRTRVNAVVVLTDGENEYPADNDLKKLLKDIALDPDRPVKVFCIAFDKSSDLKTLQAIAKASAGKTFDAQDPTMLDETFVKLLSSF
ncbi:hypothetical protein CS0771_33530 [Catellatospora sp. IY07-71]|nr:hypothetical protein CS0771_33530 [Catellatospora sp. IY07-71]